MSDYERIAAAIRYLQQQLQAQPTLEQLAAELQLSPFHVQRLFTRWAGTSPKRFLQVLTLELGKQLLDAGWPVLEASAEIGLSSSSRLHDHFVQLEAMTPGEYRRRGEGLLIEHGCADSPFGPLFMASTARGICMASFIDTAERAATTAAGYRGVSGEEALQELAASWPGATLQANAAAAQALASRMFKPGAQLPLHVQGTNFQLAVWRALLRIPPGRALSYSQLAAACGKPAAARAAGTAVGANPVAVLIPCHRVIQQSGALGGYRWHPERKLALQAWERLQRP
jgi:AraC family transcriptional regulator of adaptative response/methylated-DNA-[protein]-cysteine methyltransferase